MNNLENYSIHTRNSQHDASGNRTQAKTIRRLKTIIALIVFIAILLIVLTLFITGYRTATKKYNAIIAELEDELNRLSDPIIVYDEASREVNIALIEYEIANIGELATIEYLYTDAGKFEDPIEFFGHDIKLGLTTKSFIAKWDGIIKAGIDLEKVTVAVNEGKKEITIYLPNATILSHEIDENSIETFDEKDGLFNPLKVDDIRTFDAVTKNAMEKRAIESGILEKATDNAKDIIAKLVLTDVLERLGYSLSFETIG
ncbi:MAG: DUF4230 domain-containing protein [Oscillospiraceae bacterium]|nr:DUF4230 domain-containing protein [Oscillospiraceae bacterium]